MNSGLVMVYLHQWPGDLQIVHEMAYKFPKLPVMIETSVVFPRFGESRFAKQLIPASFFFLPHIREIPFCMDGEKPWKTWCFVVLNALDERESRSKKNGSGILNWCLQGHKRFMISCVEYYGKRKQIQPKSLRETKQLGEKSWSFPMGVVWALENPETRVTWSHIQVFNGLSIIKINYFEDSWIHGFQRRICKHTNIHHDAK